MILINSMPARDVCNYCAVRYLESAGQGMKWDYVYIALAAILLQLGVAGTGRAVGRGRELYLSPGREPPGPGENGRLDGGLAVTGLRALVLRKDNHGSSSPSLPPARDSPPRDVASPVNGSRSTVPLTSYDVAPTSSSRRLPSPCRLPRSSRGGRPTTWDPSSSAWSQLPASPTVVPSLTLLSSVPAARSSFRESSFSLATSPFSSVPASMTSSASSRPLSSSSPPFPSSSPALPITASTSHAYPPLPFSSAATPSSQSTPPIAPSPSPDPRSILPVTTPHHTIPSQSPNPVHDLNFELILFTVPPLAFVVAVVIALFLVLCVCRYRKHRRYRHHLQMPLEEMDSSSDGESSDLEQYDRDERREAAFVVTHSQSTQPMLAFDDSDCS